MNTDIVILSSTGYIYHVANTNHLKAHLFYMHHLLELCIMPTQCILVL
jgi:hypothetical protein